MGPRPDRPWVATHGAGRGCDGAYLPQAVIAGLHATAPSWEETDWAVICAAYDRLLAIADSPVVRANRALAIGFRDGFPAGLAALDEVADDPRLARSSTVPSIRADLLRRAGRTGEALTWYQTAAPPRAALRPPTPSLPHPPIVGGALLRALPPGRDVEPRHVAAIGFCFGGMCVLELARSGADVKTTVSFHGLLSTSQPAQPNSIDGSIAIYAGGKDPYAPPAQVEATRKEMAAAGAHLQVTVFADAFHGFTEPDSSAVNRNDIAYDATADRVSWAGTVALLESTIGA